MIDLGAFGWRDGVLLLAVLFGIYLVLTVLKLFQVGRSRPPALPSGMLTETLPPPPPLDAFATALAVARDQAQTEPPVAAVDTVVEKAEEEATTEVYERPRPTLFGLRRARVEEAPVQESPRLDAEMEALRREAHTMRDEIERLREEIVRMKAARNISPLYNEAMSLAQQGVPPAGIAGQCGITLGEAELVAAMARGLPAENTDSYRDGEDHDGGYDPRTGTHG